MLTPAKHVVKKLFDSAGLEIRKKRPPEAPRQDVPRLEMPPQGVSRTSLAAALRQISNLGFKPRTVIDVGVATQTSELYEGFKDSRILLIEPLAEFEPFLRRICAAYDGQYVLAAAGEKSGTAVLNVHSDKSSSSLLKEVEGELVDGAPRSVSMVTIDHICSERGLAGPYLIKVDVQGFELQVLAGASHTLNETEVVLLEVSLTPTMVGGPQFHDVVARMKELGFVTYDIWGLSYRPFDDALCQVDMAFVQEQGLFRKTGAFATREQRETLNRNSADFFEREREKLA